MSEQDDRIDELIEASSLGTPGAKALRARVSDEQVDEVMRRLERLDQERHPLRGDYRPLGEAERERLKAKADRLMWEMYDR